MLNYLNRLIILEIYPYFLLYPCLNKASFPLFISNRAVLLKKMKALLLFLQKYKLPSNVNQIANFKVLAL